MSDRCELIPWGEFSDESAVDGEGAARYIKSTNSKNTHTPIIAVSAYSGADANEGASNLFTASLSKPLQKADLLGSFLSLGGVMRV